MKRRTVIAAGTGLAAAGVLGKTGLDAVKKESTMIALRKAEDRFHSNFGWLDSHHTFSFGDHHDPAHMGFRSLRVINDDQVAAGQGFGTHGHRDMEIVSYVLSGAIEHKDSMGNGSIIKPGEIQRMTAGTGVHHSEYNPSRGEAVHFLQIWLLPEAKNLQPGYEQKAIDPASRKGKLSLIASRDGRNGGVTIHQDAEIHSALLEGGDEVRHVLKPGRHAWVHVARGELTLNGQPMRSGDGAAVSDEGALTLKASGPSEVLVFDLA